MDRVIPSRFLRPGQQFASASLQFFVDIFTITASSILQFYLRFNSGLFHNPALPEFIDLIRVTILLFFYWIFLFWVGGLYKNWYIRSPFDELFTIIKTAFFGCFLLFFFVYLDANQGSPRLLFLVYFTQISILVFLGRVIARKLQSKLRSKGIISISCILVGTADKIFELYRKILFSKNWGYSIKGIVLRDDSEFAIWVDKYSELIPDVIIGNFNAIDYESYKESIEELIVTMDSPNHDLLLNIAAFCSDNRISLKIEPDLYDYFTGQARTFHLYGIPLIEINTQLMKPWQLFTKRTIDIIFSILVLILGLPIWIIIAIFIKLESQGPVIFKQIRTGKNGQQFTMIKFRSMVKDSEKNGAVWTKVGDPRVTKFGRFIRKTHLDEIPQFYNVLKGDMSIVGPRPEMPTFVEKFNLMLPYYKRRLVVRPGITGWWQVKYTSYVETKEEIENRLKDDFYYIENMSIKLDVEIILRTVLLMFKGHGQA